MWTYGVMVLKLIGEEIMSKYSDIFAMIKALGSPLSNEELKETLVESISEGRTKSLRELSEEELQSLRTTLQKETHSKPRAGDKSRKRKRSAVLKLLTDYGIDTQDWDAINAFVESPRIAGKPFARLTNEELEKLQRKMRAILAKKREKAKKTSEYKLRKEQYRKYIDYIVKRYNEERKKRIK